jgi:hypothetical protein
VRSEHFVVQTDAGPDVAAELTSEYERIFSFFENVAFHAQRSPKGLTQVVVFQNDEDYRKVAPRLTDGFFRARGGAPYDPHPLLVMSHVGGNSEVLETFCHELTHRFVAFHFPTAPTWVHEGLATYYQTLRIEGDKAIVGTIPARHFNLGKPAKRAESQGWIASTASGTFSLNWLPPSQDIRSLSHRDFYAEDIADGEKAATTRQLNYVAAWAEVHPLLLGPDDLQSRFVRYLNGLAAGRTDAWATAFDAASERVLEAEYRDVVTRLSTRSGELTAPPAPTRPVQSRAMQSWELPWLRASLRHWGDAADRQQARSEIEEVVRMAPNRADGYLLRAALSALDGRDAEQRRDIDLAITHDPDDPRALGAKANLLMTDEAKKAPANRNYAEVEAVVKRLLPRAAGARQLLVLAHFEELQGHAPKAIQYAARAASQDAACWDCYWAIGEFELSRNDARRAVRFLRVAANMAGEHSPPLLRQRLGEALRLAE